MIARRRPVDVGLATQRLVPVDRGSDVLVAQLEARSRTLHHWLTERGRQRKTEVQLRATAQSFLSRHVTAGAYAHHVRAGMHALVNDRRSDRRFGDVAPREKGELSDARALPRHV